MNGCRTDRHHHLNAPNGSTAPHTPPPAAAACVVRGTVATALLPTYVPTYRRTDLPTDLPTYLYHHIIIVGLRLGSFVCSFVCLFVRLFVHLFIHLYRPLVHSIDCEQTHVLLGVFRHARSCTRRTERNERSLPRRSCPFRFFGVCVSSLSGRFSLLDCWLLDGLLLFVWESTQTNQKKDSKQASNKKKKEEPPE